MWQHGRVAQDHVPDVHDLGPIVDAVTRFAGHATNVRHDVEEGSRA